MRVVSGPWGTFRGWDADLVSTVIGTGVFWDQQIQPFLDEADPNGWAIDLGANLGWFTVYLARRFQQVLAVEAHPGTFDLLVDNVVANGVGDKVKPICGAAYDRRTTLHLAGPDWVGWPIASETNLDVVPNAASLAWVTGGTGLAVETIVIDHLLAGIPRVTLIKVDCQGCDLRALKGCRRLIDRDRPLIVFEYEEGASEWHGDLWEDYEGFFAARQYSLTRVRADLGDYVARPL